MSTALAEASPQQITETFSNLFHYWDRLEEFEDTVIELLPFATDEQVTQTRVYARAMGKAGWRIECACDAVLLAREPLKGGRGKLDEASVGRIAVAKEEAKKKNKAPSTIRRNAQIFNTFKTLLNVQHSLLDEKGYYEAALRAPKPKKAIKLFEKEKSENPNFSVSDAFRLAKSLKEKRDKVEIAPVENYLDPNLKIFLLDLENTLLSFKNRCPRPEFEIRIDAWIRTTRFERTRTPQSDYEAVRKRVDEGAATIEEIAEEVYLSPSEIKTCCDQMVDKEKGIYEWRPIGAHTDMARGSRAMGIFRKDAPSGDDFTVPGYNPTVEWEEDSDD